MANQNHRMTPAYSNQSHRMPSASHPIKSHLFTAFLPNQPIRLTAYAFSAQSTNQKPTHTFPGQSKPLPDFCLVSSIKNPPHALPLQPNQKPPLPYLPAHPMPQSRNRTEHNYILVLAVPFLFAFLFLLVFLLPVTFLILSRGQNGPAPR